MKKAALMIYPNFSLQEVTCLTSLFMFHKKQLDVFGAEHKIYMSEDYIQVIPNRTLAEFNQDEYDVLVLPGMIDFKEAIEDERNIQFLKSLKNNKNILIASISSSPVLLAKAGLLEDTKFSSGLFEEAFEMFEFLPKRNAVRQPITVDKNIITAIAFAYREFAIKVGQMLNIPVDESLFSGIRKEPPYSEEELTFYASK